MPEGHAYFHAEVECEIPVEPDDDRADIIRKVRERIGEGHADLFDVTINRY